MQRTLFGGAAGLQDMESMVFLVEEARLEGARMLKLRTLDTALLVQTSSAEFVADCSLTESRWAGADAHRLAIEAGRMAAAVRIRETDIQDKIAGRA